MSVSLTCFPWLVLHQCACFFRFFGNARRRLGGSRAGRRGGKKNRFAVRPLATPCSPASSSWAWGALVRGWGRELQIQTLSCPADSARLHVHRPGANDLPRRRGRRLRSPAKPGPPLGPRRGPSTGRPPISAVALSARRRFRKRAPTKWIPLFSL